MILKMNIILNKKMLCLLLNHYTPFSIHDSQQRVERRGVGDDADEYENILTAMRQRVKQMKSKLKDDQS
jgi:hypothetical protein